jgi:hypothetical protein
MSAFGNTEEVSYTSSDDQKNIDRFDFIIT